MTTDDRTPTEQGLLDLLVAQEQLRLVADTIRTAAAALTAMDVADVPGPLRLAAAMIDNVNEQLDGLPSRFVPDTLAGGTP